MVANAYDYISSLSLLERAELGKETGYSPRYFTLLASTRRNMSDVLVMTIYRSKFNKKPRGQLHAQLTEAMVNQSLKELQEARLAKRKKIREGKRYK